MKVIILEILFIKPKYVQPTRLNNKFRMNVFPSQLLSLHNCNWNIPPIWINLKSMIKWFILKTSQTIQIRVLSATDLKQYICFMIASVQNTKNRSSEISVQKLHQIIAQLLMQECLPDEQFSTKSGRKIILGSTRFQMITSRLIVKTVTKYFQSQLKVKAALKNMQIVRNIRKQNGQWQVLNQCYDFMHVRWFIRVKQFLSLNNAPQYWIMIFFYG